MNCGILNKENTCYINASLQSFRSMVKLWANFSLYTDTLSPFVSSFVRTMSMLRSRKADLDPTQFLCCLENIVVKSGKEGFDLFQQQDASEVMSCAIEESCGELPHAQELLTTTLKH